MQQKTTANLILIFNTNLSTHHVLRNYQLEADLFFFFSEEGSFILLCSNRLHVFLNECTSGLQTAEISFCCLFRSCLFSSVCSDHL